MKLTSSSFTHSGAISERYTCEGENISPVLSWSEAPKEAKSFALVMHDPDAPRNGGFVHWILYNIPANVTQIAENVPAEGSISGQGMQSANDRGRLGYTGPCPPSGEHRYFFHLYALRSELDLKPGASRGDLSKAMQGRLIEETELMGTYIKTANRLRSSLSSPSR